MNIQSIFSELDILYGKSRAAAEKYLVDMLTEARLRQNADAEVSLLNEYMGLLRSNGRMEQALLAGEELLSVCKRGNINSGVNYATTLLNVATTKRCASMVNEALEIYDQVERIYRVELPENDERIAALYNNTSTAWLELNELGKAAGCLEKAIRILENIPEAYVELAIAYSNLGMLMIRSKDNLRAAELLRKAQNIFEPLPYRDIHYPSTLSGLAHLEFANGNLDGAIKLYEKAMAIVEDTIGHNRDFIALCRNCATVYKRLGELQKANELLERANSFETLLRGVQ